MECFLLRIGQKEASRKLWEDYKKKEKAELLEKGESRNLKLWEEINEKKSDQKKSKERQKSCRKICAAVLSLLILCSWMISFHSSFMDLICQGWIVLIPVDLI